MSATILTRRLPPLLAVCLLVGGCGGGSGSSSKPAARAAGTTAAGGGGARDIFISSMTAGLQKGTLPPDYTKCVIEKAKSQVSDAEVQRLVGLPASRREAQSRAVGVDLGRQCVKQGAGLAQFKAKYLDSLSSALAKNKALPPSFRTCILARASKTPNSVLTQLFTDSVTGTNARGVALGRAMGKQCLSGR